MSQPAARLTERFIERADATGMTDAAIAAAIGVTRQFYSAVKAGKEQPTTKFMTGAVRAGLADNFGEVAEPVPTKVA